MTREEIPSPGLTREEHGDLNRSADFSYPGGIEAKQKRIKELRIKYAGNEKALAEIDAYESSPDHMKKVRALIALLTGKSE